MSATPRSLVNSGIVSEHHEYRGVHIKAGFPHLEDKMSAICEAPKFRKWIDKFNLDEIEFSEFTVTDADFFGPVNPSRLGFVKGHGVASDKQSGDRIPAIAFIRGDSVAVLIIVHVKETGCSYVLLCKQLRFPVGQCLTEACAGMLDDKIGTVTGVVFNEIKEETGFIIEVDSLISLGPITPSGGGCDESIHLYAWETSITQAEFEEKQTATFGDGEYEKIKLVFREFETFDDTLDMIGDVKAECCWRRYKRYLEGKKLF